MNSNGTVTTPIVVRPSRRRAAPRRKAPVLKRLRHPKPIRLSERDLEVLRALSLHRFLSGDQLHRLTFPGRDASLSRRRLRALFDHNLVERMAVVSQPSRGIPPLVYALTKAGRDVLVEDGADPDHRGWLRFSRHRHLVNDFYVTLMEGSRQAGFTISDWRHEESLRLPGRGGLGTVERITIREPGRQPRSVPFQPDGFFCLTDCQGHRYAFFVEIDLATHPLRVWRQRARLYTTYDCDGLFRKRFGRETFRLLIITTPDYRQRSRRGNILNTVQREVGESDMFLATTLADLNASTVFGDIWHLPGGSHPVSLVPQASVRVQPRQRVRVSSAPKVTVS